MQWRGACPCSVRVSQVRHASRLFQATAAAAFRAACQTRHGAAMVKVEMDELGLKIDERYSGPKSRPRVAIGVGFDGEP